MTCHYRAILTDRMKKKKLLSTSTVLFCNMNCGEKILFSTLFAAFLLCFIFQVLDQVLELKSVPRFSCIELFFTKKVSKFLKKDTVSVTSRADEKGAGGGLRMPVVTICPFHGYNVSRMEGELGLPADHFNLGMLSPFVGEDR